MHWLEEIAKKQAAETKQRFDDYENLVNWAKENGIKGIRYAVEIY